MPLSSASYVRVVAAGSVAVAAAVLSLAIGGPPVPSSGALRGGERPNVIVVMVDDQSLKTFDPEIMPRTFGLINGGEGRILEGYASPPLCCPSRAGFLTGQYPHNHGVVRNNWKLLRQPDNTLAAWLQADGYKTGFAGKYLNEYRPAPEPAGGYDSWFQLIGKRPGYFDYVASLQGKQKEYGSKREDYSTTVVTRKAQGFIRRSAGQPFFLWTSYYAPHTRRSKHPRCGVNSPQPLAKDWHRFRDAPVRLPPSFDERNVSDKPSRIRNLDRLGHAYAEAAKDDIRCASAAMQEVDRGVGDIRSTLRNRKIDDDTIIFYISDNGLMFGEHRIAGKSLPYFEAARVPLLAHVPRKILDGESMSAISEPVANIDLAPTILELTGAEPCTASGSCRVMDGRSIAGLMRGDESDWPDPRPIGMELGFGCGDYRGAYQGSEVYIEYLRRVRGDCKVSDAELYDLASDPFQLRNRLFRPTADAIDDGERLSEVAQRLSTCSGIEGRDPPRPGRPFC